MKETCRDYKLIKTPPSTMNPKPRPQPKLTNSKYRPITGTATPLLTLTKNTTLEKADRQERKTEKDTSYFGHPPYNKTLKANIGK